MLRQRIGRDLIVNIVTAKASNDHLHDPACQQRKTSFIMMTHLDRCFRDFHASKVLLGIRGNALRTRAIRDEASSLNQLRHSVQILQFSMTFVPTDGL